MFHMNVFSCELLITESFRGIQTIISKNPKTDETYPKKKRYLKFELGKPIAGPVCRYINLKIDRGIETKGKMKKNNENLA